MPKALKNANLLCYPSARVTSSVYDSDDGMTVERPLASLDKAFVTFEVGKQYFKVPRALLALNSDAFGGMLSASFDTGEPVSLSDSAMEFSVLCRTLRRPFCSPLLDRKPVLADVLALVKLSHKYGIHSLEHQSLRLLMNLVQSSSIRQHLSTVGSSTDTSCTRVAHVANVINNEELLRYVAEFYLKECAEQNRHLDAFRKIASPCLPLRFALKYCRGYPDLYSRFLYEAMVAGAAAWGEDPDIVLKQKLQLGIGSAECCIVWEATVSNWKRDVGNAVRARRYYSKSAPSCLCKYSRSGCKLTSDIMSQLITGGSLIPAYDILKKLRSILDLGSLANADYDDDGWDCRDVVKEVVVQKIEYHVSKLPQYFHLD